MPADAARFRRSDPRDGIVPRTPSIPGIEHHKVASYTEIVDGRRQAGPTRRPHRRRRASVSTSRSCSAPAIRRMDTRATAACGRSGRSPRSRRNGASIRAIATAAGSCLPTIRRRRASCGCLQRKADKVGAGLAKTTGWIRRTLLKKRGVAMTGGVEYQRIDDAGLHIKVDGQPADARCRHDRHLRGPGTASRALRRSAGRGHCRPRSSAVPTWRSNSTRAGRSTRERASPWRSDHLR